MGNGTHTGRDGNYLTRYTSDSFHMHFSGRLTRQQLNKASVKLFNAFVSCSYSPVNSVESHNQPGENLDRLPKRLFLILTNPDLSKSEWTTKLLTLEETLCSPS